MPCAKLATRGARAKMSDLMPKGLNLPPFNTALSPASNLVERILQQTQAFPRRRDPIRQTRRQLLASQARLNPNLDAL